eukprot:TRINITY_DN13069_c0_g1_i1.p1 TRINITY_DN13069_c0_g1~~TRINITY_DN13069_c0_g1_i1.p1  ORF type:complete len:426 (+),score=118.81 TRINITY_DN13069_c0_g1_i1:54-1331(+)
MRCLRLSLRPARREGVATASLRWVTQYSERNFNVEYDKHVTPADEDVSNLVTIPQLHKRKVVTSVASELNTSGVRSRAAMRIQAPVTNRVQAHLQEQIKKNNPSFHHFEMVDFAVPGVEGLWYYPFFFTPEEQRAAELDISPIFRDERVSMRVKNTCTIMRSSIPTAPTTAFKDVRHGWGDRNNPLIGRVGRRNLAHISTDTCEARKPNFVPLDACPGVAAAMDKVWRYFGEGQNSFPREGQFNGKAVDEWHPVLDRRPNLVRCSEWMEGTTGMNAHVKAPSFGNYIGIVNLHSSTVLQLCHKEEDMEEWQDDEVPDGAIRASKVVLHPGSLTILKHEARWAIPLGYSYEGQHIFRRNAWPKDYRCSLMFSHFSKAHPGDPTLQPEPSNKVSRQAAKDPDSPPARDPSRAGITDRATPPQQVSNM